MDDVWGEDSGDDEGPPRHQEELSRERDTRRQQFYNVGREGERRLVCMRVCWRARACRADFLFFSRAPFMQAGYRDGLEEGKQLSIQEGFNAGASSPWGARGSASGGGGERRRRTRTHTHTHKPC